METNRTNSFQTSEKYAYQEDLFSSGSTVRNGEEKVFASSINFAEIIKRVMQILQKLFVALKYQLFKRTQGMPKEMNFSFPFRTSWFKLAFVALAAFVVFKKDLSFSVNMKDPEGVIADRDQDNNMSQNNLGGFAQSISLKEEDSQPFEDKNWDNAETKNIKAYIRRFKDIAQAEHKKYGIPASVKMAQAIVESNAGRSRLSKKNNNHFGIKCFSKNCRKGHCSNFSDDHHKDFFRKYPNAWESWRAHSQLIINGRYKGLLEEGNNYKSWANGLRKLGYATDKNYTTRLLKTIETYKLYLLDR